MQDFSVVGIVAAVASILAFFPYILDTIARRTRPARATWLVWSVVASISLAVQVSAGADASLWFSAAQVGCTCIIFLLSIWVGFGRYVNRVDWVVICTCAIGVGAWFYTDDAVYAQAVAIAISAVGAVPTLLKSLREPQSETLITWMTALLAAVLCLLSIEGKDPLLMAYPAYLTILYWSVSVAILMGRARAKHRVSAAFTRGVFRTTRPGTLK